MYFNARIYFYPDLIKKHITRLYWLCGFSNQPCHIILSKENGPRQKMYGWKNFVDSIAQKIGHLFLHFSPREQKFSVSKDGIRWVVQKCTVILNVVTYKKWNFKEMTYKRLSHFWDFSSFLTFLTCYIVIKRLSTLHFCLFAFLSQKESFSGTKKNVFYFTSKALFLEKIEIKNFRY